MADMPLVLIVDDDADFRDICKMKLLAEGIRVETAENGEEGIMKAKALKPTLMLLDMKMPGASGADTILKLREDPAMKEMKVIFLSAFGDPRAEFQEFDKRVAAEMGAVDYVKKTDDLSILVDKVKILLE